MVKLADYSADSHLTNTFESLVPMVVLSKGESSRYKSSQWVWGSILIPVAGCSSSSHRYTFTLPHEGPARETLKARTHDFKPISTGSALESMLELADSNTQSANSSGFFLCSFYSLLNLHRDLPVLLYFFGLLGHLLCRDSNPNHWNAN